VKIITLGNICDRAAFRMCLPNWEWGGFRLGVG